MVWQSRATAPLCEELRRAGLEPLVRERTGLAGDAVQARHGARLVGERRARSTGRDERVLERGTALGQALGQPGDGPRVGDEGGDAVERAIVRGGVRAVHRRLGERPTPVRPKDHEHVPLRDVLVDLAAGEAREVSVLGEHRDLQVEAAPVRAGQEPVGERPGLLERDHRPTPTRTLRKRATGEPCDTWAICRGCPLPQLGVPPQRQLAVSPSASRLAQNSGVRPA